MIIDNNLILSGAVSGTGAVTGQIAAGSGNILSANTVDLLQARDLGEGTDFYLRTQVLAAVTGGTSVEIQAIAADDAGLNTGVTVIGSTGAIPVASLTVGARFACAINPRIASKGQRYLGARYVITGATSTGTFFTDVGLEIQDGQKVYPGGFAVL